MTPRRFSWILGAATLIATLSAVSHALAQADGKAAAEALFQDARRLMAEGKYAEACPKLASSQKLDPGFGTLLNLGDCYEKNGQTASAWGQFMEAAAEAQKGGDERRMVAARERAAALEGRLARLTIVVPDASAVPDLEVTRDGTVLDRPLWGQPLPVDAGARVIKASAPGRNKWTTTVQVAEGDAQARVEIPPLEAAPEPVAAPAIPAASEQPAAQPPPTDSESESNHTLALVVGGVGVAGIAVGTIFGVGAMSTWDDAQAACDAGDCDKGNRLGADAGTSADIATAGFVVGGVGLAAALVLFIVAPGESESPSRAASPRVSPFVGAGTAGVAFAGRL